MKFKKCCLNAAKSGERPKLAPAFLAQMEVMMRQQQAAERVRLQQQGHGNPILSWQDEGNGFRFVAVKMKIYYARDWVLFPNFLDHFMKLTLGREWGEREREKGAHPLFRWLRKTHLHSSRQPGEPKVKSIEMMGFMAAWLHLAYALYLIAHHDELPEPLLRRLRNAVEFMPAYHEAIVGAALAVAGMEIDCAEKKSGSVTTPEFRATSKTSGKTYEVEAKRKNGWKALTEDVTGEEFQRELKGYVRNQLHKASSKKLTNPVYWFELSIPTMLSESDWRVVTEAAEAAIREAEKTLKVDGQPIAPAYVVVTNHTFLANEDLAGNPCFGFLQTIKMDDYPFGQLMEIEAALEGYDNHRDIFWLMEAWKTASTVPTTFDGSPPELLDRDGRPQRSIKIGDTIEVPDKDGRTVRATIEELASFDNTAMLAVHANGCRWMVQMPLTAAESQAALRYTDAVFGKDNAPRDLRDDDPFDLYDWMLDVYASMTHQYLDEYFDGNPTFSQYRSLPLKDARKRIAREYTKLIWLRGQKDNI